MFRPEKMSLVNISVLDEYLTQVLDRLAKLGVMHIVDKAELPASAEAMENVNTEPVRNELTKLSSRLEEMLAVLSIAVGFVYIQADSD